MAIRDHVSASGGIRGWIASCAALWALAACSGGDAPDRDRTGQPGVQGGGDTSTAGTGGGGGATDFGGGPQQPTQTPNMPRVQDDTDMAGGMVGPIEPILIDDCGADNPAGLADASVAQLKAGGGSAPRVLYPYDGTVFPRGMLAPTLMWDGAATEAVYVHIQSTHFEWHGCVLPTGLNALELPQDVWDAASARTLGTADPFTIELSTLSGGSAAGPARLSVTIAQATIKGSIYYNSYSSALAGLSLGAVLRIPPGGKAEAFVNNECNGCHSVSADGSRMISQTLNFGGRAYKLEAGGASNPAAMPGTARIAFAALYPDGSRYLATYASPTVEVARANLTALGAPPAAQLFETDTATLLTSTGIPEGAMMPTFSPDGTKLVFTDLAVNNAHGLAIVDFDGRSNTASNYRVLHEDATLRPGWPFVLPDNGAVIFTKTNGGDFSGEAAGLLGVPGLGPISDLYIVDVATGTTQILAQAMGYATPQDAASDNTYLPFGAGDLHKNYFPTVSPVAAGGYFWVFFDGVRNYGNLGLQRQLWGSAISISPTGDYTVDRSHPPFYLPGQEFGTGNHRAFAALDACVQDGDDCLTGIDCCGGFCFIPEDTPSEFGEEPVGKCTSETPMCAKRDDRCTVDADCCPPMDGEPQNTCIAGFCAYIPLE